MAQPSETAHSGRLGRGLTVDPRNGPVASDAAGNAGQLEDEGPGVGVRVVVGGRDVDAVDVLVHPLADLGLLGYESRGVVINIYQVDLQRAGAGGGRRAWEQRWKGRGGDGVGVLGVGVGEKIASRWGRKAVMRRLRETRDGRRGKANHEGEERPRRNNFSSHSEGEGSALFTALVLEERCGRVGLAASDNTPQHKHVHTSTTTSHFSFTVKLNPWQLIQMQWQRPAGRKQARRQ